MAIDSQEIENMVVWRSFRLPFYEVYYLKFNFDGMRRAAWLRYTLLAPKRGLGEPSASLWGMYFDRENPAQNVAVKETASIERTTIDHDIFFFQILDEGAIYNNGARGKAESGGHSVSWDLQYPPNEQSFKLFPRIFYALPIPKSKLISPNWSIRPSGWIQTDGTRRKVESAFGCQAHIWGTQHAERWAWAHCNSFSENAGVVFEALTAQIRLGKKLSPPMTLMALSLPGGRILRFTRMTHWFFNKSRYDIGSWEIKGSSGHWRLNVSLKAQPDQMIGVTYTDTDLSKLYCYHCESASFHLELYEYRKGKFALHQSWESPVGAYEVVERSPLPGMKLFL